MARGRVSIDDVLRLARIQSVSLSPQGGVAFDLTLSDLEANKNRSEIRVRMPDGREAYLQGEGDRSPKWSPRGDRLVFISSRDGGKQKGSGVYVYGFEGEPRRVAWFKHGVSSVEWLDDNRVAVAAFDEVKGEYDEDYVATDRLPLWFDGSGLVAGLRSQVFIVDVDSGSTVKVTDEEHGVEVLGVCGGRIYYATPRTWRNPLDMVVKSVDAEGGVRVEAEGFTVGTIRCVERASP